jgi:putative ABC transport system permease protein
MSYLSLNTGSLITAKDVLADRVPAETRTAFKTSEVGIRHALGADQSDILWLVLRLALVMMLLGIALGLGRAFALTRVLTALLFHVSPTDPVIFATIASLFLVTALTASYIPARRAARIDPMTALRV